MRPPADWFEDRFFESSATADYFGTPPAHAPQPCARPEPIVEIDGQKALRWLLKGAKLTDTTRNILSKKGIMAAYAEGKSPEDLAPQETEAPADQENDQASTETES